MEDGPLFDKVKEEGGEKALEELKALVKKYAEWTPPGDANPPENWEQRCVLRNKNNIQLKPLRTWLENDCVWGRNFGRRA